jgi:hypothetical protein
MRYNILFALLYVLNLCLHAQSSEKNDSLRNTSASQAIFLDEVVVKAKNKNVESRGLGNMRINMRLLEVSPLFMGERDIIKTFQFLPGVSSGMEGSSQLNIRGGTNDQTLYLMDDVPVYNQNHTFGLFSIFNSDALASADLYKGGVPALYGDRLSGVLSAEIKEGDFKGYHHSVSLGVLAGTIFSEGPIVKDRLSYLFTGRRSFIDLFYNGFMAMAGEGNGGGMFSFYDINTKLTWKINNKNNLSVQFYTGYDDLYGMNKEKDDYLNEKTKEKYGYGWKSYMTSLRYKSQLSENISLSTTLYYTDLNNFDYYKSEFKAPDVKVKSGNGNASLFSELGGKMTFTNQTSANNTLRYGIEGSNQLYTPTYAYKYVNEDKIEYNTDYLKLFKLSGYFYDEFRYKQWLFSVGMRASLFDNMEFRKYVWEPRIKVNTFVNDKNKLMLAYDRMHQPVHTINEMDYNAKTDSWIPFQEGALPQSDQISIGWKNYFNTNLSFSVEAYYKTMKNLLLIKDLEYYLDFHSDYEQGKGKSTGIEFMAEYSNNNFTTWMSYTLSKANRLFGGRSYPFKYDAPHDLSLFISYALPEKKEKKHTFSIQMQYKTGYPYYVPEISYPGMGLPSSPDGYYDVDDLYQINYIPQYPNVRLNDYLRIDANYTLEKKLKHGSLSWQFSLLNVINRKNPYAVYKKDGKYKAFILIPILPSVSVKRTF